MDAKAYFAPESKIRCMLPKVPYHKYFINKQANLMGGSKTGRVPVCFPWPFIG